MLFNLIMVISRKKRTSVFRQLVEKEWSEYFWEFVLKYTDKLDWDYISRNPNISMRIIEKYSDKPWNWSYISWNPNIAMEFIEKHPNKPWDWYGISRDTFNYEKELFIEKRMKEYLASYRIQQYYWKGICNPHCQIGYNKVNRDYDKLFTEDGRVKRIKIS